MVSKTFSPSPNFALQPRSVIVVNLALTIGWKMRMSSDGGSIRFALHIAFHCSQSGFSILSNCKLFHPSFGARNGAPSSGSAMPDECKQD